MALTMLFSCYTFSQNHSCGFDQANKDLFNSFPNLKQEIEQKYTDFDNSKLNDDCTNITTIPIVFHFLYDNNNLNQGYRNDNFILNTTLGDLNSYFSQPASIGAGLPPAFNAFVADGTCIEFCLAQYDHPQNTNLYGNDLNRDGIKDSDGDGIIDQGEYAINRYTISSTVVNDIFVADTTSGISQSALIQSLAPAWNPTEYLNVYVVPRLSNNKSGYTFLPNDSGAQYNSIYMDNFYLNRYILAHEVGHWLGLAHTWGGYDPNDPDDFSCTNNDYWMTPSNSINDTYPQETARGFSGCNATTDNGVPQSCGSVDNIFNLMDYSFCSDTRSGVHFTSNQASYMNSCFTNVDSRLNFANNMEYSKCTDPNGCTDPIACNYSPGSTIDDGSCLLPDCLGECLGQLPGNSTPGTFCNDGDPTTTNDFFDNDCNCIGTSFPGCTDDSACNFDPNATLDDGSCIPSDCAGICVGGQTGPTGPGDPCDDNDPTTIDDVYDANCNCGGVSVPGCIDPDACNFDATATVDDGTCNPKDCAGDCDGLNTGSTGPGSACDDGDPTTQGDLYDANCNCIGNAIPGCTDINACNFNSFATFDDGSCNLPDCEGNCLGSNTGSVGEGDPCDDGDPATIGDVYDANCNCSGNFILGCTDADACNYNFFATLDDGSCNLRDCEGNCNGSQTGPAGPGSPCDDDNPNTSNDVYDANCNCGIVPISGCTDQNACNFDPLANTDDGSCNLPDCEGICDGLNTGPAGPGTSCDDGDPITIDTEYDDSCNCVEVNQNCATTIEMGYAGWHMISTFCQPIEDSIEVIFAPVVNNIIQVKNLTGQVYVPSFNNFNSGLYTWDMAQGYLVKTNAPTTLTITGGQEVDLAVDYIPLSSGWNMIAYWLQGKAYPIDVFNSIEMDVIQVKDLSGSYIPSFNYFDSIDTIRMNNGYQIKMNAPNNLFFDPVDAALRPAPATIEKVAPKHFKKKILPNPNNATMLFLEDNNPMSFGDEIGIFTTDGILVASFVYQNEMMGGLVYGDDLTEDGKDGLEDNERYIFKVWDANLDIEKIVEMNFEQGSDRFVKDDLVAVSFKSESTTGINVFYNDFNVSLNPNPATNEVTFSIDLEDASSVLIEIFNIEGKLIEVVSDQKMIVGKTKINHPVSHLNNGMYLYKVTDGNASTVGKFIISR